MLTQTQFPNEEEKSLDFSNPCDKINSTSVFASSNAMKDSSMANDSVATNFEQIFTTYSPETIRKIL